MNKLYTLGLAALAVFTSCETSVVKDYIVETPEYIAKMEELNKFETILNYSDEGMKIGTLVNPANYKDMANQVTTLVNSNFNEVQAAGLSHASLVKKDGSLNFTDLNMFVTAAEKYEMPIFGSPILDYANQNNAYLETLIAPYYKDGAASTWIEEEVHIISNGDFSAGDNSTNFSGWTMGGEYGFRDAGPDGSRCIYFRNPKVQNDGWAGQVQVKFDPIRAPQNPGGDTYFMEFDVKAGKSINIGQCTIVDCWIGVPFTPSQATTEWTKMKAQFTVTPGSGIIGKGQLNFDFGFHDTEIWMDNFKIYRIDSKEVHGVLTERTPQEKKDTMVYAMSNYVDTLVAAAPYIKNWVVAANIMSDENPTEIKTGGLWQDNIGKDYVREAVALARSASSDVKLFVEDGGLENLDKCQGLLDMIKYWESDGETVIDGISVVLNPECNLSEDLLISNLEAITAMFVKLGESGRIIRLAGLDMSISDGDTELSMPLFDVEEKLMGDYYTSVIKAYMDNIPAEQQYGIYKNNLVDSASKPIGLWTSDYNRKFAYKGFVESFNK